ncbi:hypothetical protein REPUB_Repub05bG0151500 [Reevesia pubescens]
MKTHKNPKANFLYELNSCSKSKYLKVAIGLYESVISNKTRFNQHHFNTLIYLCSTFATDLEFKNLCLTYGFQVFDHMMALNIHPNQASITAIARLAIAKGDGDYAFEMVKKLDDYQIRGKERVYEYLQKLRSVRWVSEETGKVLEDWFCNKGSELGFEEVKYKAGFVKEAVLRNSGGWHGLGWIGEGMWVVKKGNVELNGRCCG